MLINSCVEECESRVTEFGPKLVSEVRDLFGILLLHGTISYRLEELEKIEPLAMQNP